MENKYITYDQLMNSVEQGLEMYLNENLIDRNKYIKVVRKINAELGLKLNSEREVILPIKDRRVELPKDFQYAQLVMICKATDTPIIKGDAAENSYSNVHVDPIYVDGCTKYCPPGAILDDCNNCYYVAKSIVNNQVTTFTIDTPVKLTKRSLNFCADGKCGGTNDLSHYTIDIKDNQITVNLKEGNLYLNYLSDLVDDDGNLLVLDHPLVNGYYEYSIKHRIFEDLFLNSDADVERKLQYAYQRLQESKIQAHSFVNTVEYDTICELYRNNRRLFYRKYSGPIID